MSAPVQLGVTVGDPAGIGPEITLKALQEIARRPQGFEFAPILYGSRAALADAARLLDLPVRLSEDGSQDWPALRVVDVAASGTPILPGAVSAAAGEIAFRAIERAVRDAMQRRLAAIVTGPISKEAINLAGHNYAGHTDMLADLTGSPDTCMMLAHDRLRVTHVSTHVALERVPSLVTRPRLQRVLELTTVALHDLGISAPRIGVAALNPHAGEGNLFGREDSEIIAPTVDEFRAHGFDVTGPISGDTVFVRALAGEFDAVVAMFHDQGHIPVKLLGFKVDRATGKWTSLSGVNITLGLPFVRTSVDHGTAFDIAGKGVASAQSMVEALDLAVQLGRAGWGGSAFAERRARS